MPQGMPHTEVCGEREKNMQKKTIFVLVVVLMVSILVAGGKFSSGAVADDSTVLGKLEEVVKGQNAILEDLKAIKLELNIIKVRVTQQQ